MQRLVQVVKQLVFYSKSMRCVQEQSTA